jgi:redox-sensitive bicupin YhaK (pirin superfamily)
VVETLRAGEFHRTTLGPGFHYQETNASPTHWVHLFQVWLTAPEGCEPGHETKRFASAERRHSLCLVASPDGRLDSLTVHQDAMIYSAIMAKGRHLIHPLAEDRSACLCVVEGEIQLSDTVLKSGDMALLTNERSVSFSSREHSEVLLLDKSKSAQLQNGANAPSK